MITRTSEKEPLDLITLYEAADIIGVSYATIKRYVTTRKLPAYQLPDSEFRVSRHELHEWVRSMYIPAEATRP